MANFKESFDKVVLAEGGYVNDPDDSGGETYLGITRVHHPTSSMWAIIDDYKKSNGVLSNAKLTALLKKDDRLTKEAEVIYKKEYWDKMKLDEVPSQGLAHQLFDHGVNAGVGSAVKLAEELVALPKTGNFGNVLLNRLKLYGTV